MRRLLIGLGGFLFLLVTTILVVPFLLPKEEIKRQVVAQVDERLGWRVRLDGPVSISLFPWFSLVAEDIGVSGEAGADGIEFAKARKMAFGLAWAGLISGDVKVTAISLDQPDIYLEIGPRGTPSWAPRRRLEGEAGAQVDAADLSPSAAQVGSSQSNDASTSSDTAQGYLRSIEVDRVSITGGTLTYRDARSEEKYVVRDLALTLAAPDLTSKVDLSSSFVFQEVPLSVAGNLGNPLGFIEGKAVPVDLKVSSGENIFDLKGTAGHKPLAGEIALKASGPSVKALAALLGQELAADPGAYELTTRISGDQATVRFADLSLVLGKLSLGGSADINLAGLVPEATGQLLLKNGAIADLLLLAGRDLPASGNLAANLAFQTVGLTAEEMVTGLDMNGSISISDAEIGGLGLASTVGGDPAADRIKDLSVDIALQGLKRPIALNGALSWRGEGFSITGQAATAQFLDGAAAPVTVTIKGNRLSAGFDGQVARSGDLDGAVRVETGNLRSLMAWLGQPIGEGGGLRAFKASGIFGVQGDAISFEETRFTLDATYGEAKGRVVLGAKPTVTASLALQELVLDPYLSAGAPTGGASTSSNAVAAQGGTAPAVPQAVAQAGWSTAPINFSGLNAVDVDFKMTTQQIRWEKIKIDQSALTTTIKNGVLTASLDNLSLYGGSGQGQVTLDGSAAQPSIAATLALSGLNAHPLLNDAAEFAWIEGKTAISFDVTAQGASEAALVQSLNGTAVAQFADGAIRGINIPKMVRGLSVETLLGWQENPSAKTDFSSLGASFQIQNGVARTEDLSLIGPLVRMSGVGTTDMPQKTLSWRVEPRIVPTLEGQAPAPRPKGEDKKLAGLGVPIVIEGPWDNPRIYPDIAGILQNPEAAYQQLQEAGGELISILNGQKAAPDALAETANQAIERATGGQVQIDVQKVIDGEVNDQEVLKAVEEGFGLPAGALGTLFGGKKN